MHPRLFRLIEKHQRVDELLRTAQRKPMADRSEIQRLQGRKIKAKHLIHRFTQGTALASA